MVSLQFLQNPSGINQFRKSLAPSVIGALSSARLQLKLKLSKNADKLCKQLIWKSFTKAEFVLSDKYITLVNAPLFYISGFN